MTHSVPKTLNPEWNAIEQFPINSVQNLLLDVICWDKDRFGKDYMGEFDLALEEVFQNERTEIEPRWFPLKSKRPGKKTGKVSGEVQLQFTLFDANHLGAPSREILGKFHALISAIPGSTPSTTPLLTSSTTKSASSGLSGQDEHFEDDEDGLSEFDDDESEDASKPDTAEKAEKRRRRLRIKGLKKRRRDNPYAFNNSSSDVVGIIFLEISKITDLPPESNLTRTSFDMDPFVVASLGKKTYRTRRVRHNLNPVYNEKMIFHVQSHEKSYSFSFTVIDHDKYSGNDFIAACSLPIHELVERAPQADPETGLYGLREPPDHVPSAARSRFKKLSVSRSSSTQSLTKLIRPQLSKNPSSTNVSPQGTTAELGQTHSANGSVTSDVQAPNAADNSDAVAEGDDGDFHEYVVPLKMKNLDKWESKHSPKIYLKAKYMPYPALRQQFWRAMLRQYDTDESGQISRVELTTMLDTLGSTLRESTIDSFFHRFPHKAADNEDSWDLTMDEAVICLEDQLAGKGKPKTVVDKVKSLVPDLRQLGISNKAPGADEPARPAASGTSTPAVFEPKTAADTTDGKGSGEEDSDENGEREEEHVVEIRECPICHQPRLNKRSDTDIITHIATCASQDWRQVNTVLMGGFVTASQAQRKWYSKVITKISYGGYKLGANSANILVQDRITGQINEEKMSVYVRLGIRLLYKGLKSRDMENKRSRFLSGEQSCWGEQWLTQLTSPQDVEEPEHQARQEIRRPGFQGRD